MKSPGRIYLVDDDELILSMLSRALSREGYDVRTENSGLNAVKNISSWHPDVVLLDINLPGQSGLEILEQLQGAFFHPEIIMLTADGSSQTIARAMNSGAFAYLTKPFSLDVLKTSITSAMKKLKNERVLILND